MGSINIILRRNNILTFSEIVFYQKKREEKNSSNYSLMDELLESKV